MFCHIYLAFISFTSFNDAPLPSRSASVKYACDIIFTLWIDLWLLGHTLKALGESTDILSQEQELKLAADAVLCEVRKKQGDVKRMQDVLRSLEKLRKLRKEAASRKGDSYCTCLSTIFPIPCMNVVVAEVLYLLSVNQHP